MSTARRVAKNTLVMVFGEIGAKVFTVSYTILLARHLLVEGFGVLSFFLALTGVLRLFTDVGFFELTIREVARNKAVAKKFFSNLLLLKSIIVVVVFGAFFLYLFFANYPQEAKLLAYLLGLAVAIDSLASIFRSIFQGLEEMIYISLGKILRSATLLSGTVVLVLFNFGLVEFGVLYLIANAISFTFLISALVKKIMLERISFEFDKSFWKMVFREGIPFWAATAFVVILNDTDKIMLYAMVGERAVGFYSAAYRMVFALNFLPLMFIAALYPVTSRLFTKSTASLVKTSEISFKFVLVVGLFIVVTLSGFSETLILTIFGEEFSSSAEPLKILAWSQLFLYFNVVLGNLFRSADMQIIKTYQVAAAAILNVFLNFLLIPIWSFVGASFATLIARSFSFAFLGFVAIRHFDFSKPLFIQSTIVVLLSASFVYASILSKNSLILVVGLIAILAFLYAKIFDESDRRILIKLIKME
ncbi:polysaccharide biosynthesis protein [Ferroglobus placidus DSM 10642]|uniref:Polysaccharide biosynthesis protein n=1 Tax=Ferroglobus placidus (strain DSM 10642 / AEDII12DO) TaxID=589924 RepID=D3RZY8_FERPA|nr:flippase [Ferroglobus placidus]ADC66051.1 polysaccharide biosynthesis protein [Ferroglobus placidus DSM 10642]